MKKVYIVGGPNGAGKTTFIEQYLPNYVHVNNFINADSIAYGLSPLDSSLMQIKAGKIMLQLIEELKNKGLSFGFETTLAGKKWLDLIEELKTYGYFINIFFLDIPSLEVAHKRVEYRVEMGGHSIPQDTITRRFYRSKYNFWNVYRDFADYWALFDNSQESPQLIADKEKMFCGKYLSEFVDTLETKEFL